MALYQYLKSINKYNVIGTYNTKRVEGLVSYQLEDGNLQNVRGKIGGEEKTAIICSAISKIDYCKKEYESAYKVNVVATKRLIRQLSEEGYYIIFFSSSDVFGKTAGYHTEEDSVCPVNKYGEMKAEVEEFLMNFPHTCVIRVGKVVGTGDTKDILYGWMQDAMEKKVIRCIGNNYFTPAYIDDIAVMVEKIVERRLEGVYHLCGQERINRTKLCKMFLQEMGLETEIIEQDESEFHFLDQRALDSSLDCSKIQKILECRVTPWTDIFNHYR